MAPRTTVALRWDNSSEKASSQRSSMEMMKLWRNSGNAGIISQALSHPFQREVKNANSGRWNFTSGSSTNSRWPQKTSRESISGAAHPEFVFFSKVSGDNRDSRVLLEQLSRKQKKKTEKQAANSSSVPIAHISPSLPLHLSVSGSTPPPPCHDFVHQMNRGTCCDWTGHQKVNSNLSD